MMTILAGCFIAVMVVTAITRLYWRRRQSLPADRLTYEAVVKLHAIRQRLNVSQSRSEVRREGVRVRRALQAELRRWEQWDRR
jgi:hypothetical protein